MKKLGVTTIIVVLIVALTVGPLLTLWTLNTLFPALAIPYVFKTWLAALLLNMTLATKVSR
jgi:hypothetical protein